MFCNKCGKQLQDDMLFCTGCGAPVKKDDLPRRPEQKPMTQNAAKPQGVPKTAAAKPQKPQTARPAAVKPQKAQPQKGSGGKKPKAWLLPVILLTVLALGAGAYFLFFRSSGSVDLNKYLVPSISGKNGEYSMRVGLDSARLIQDNKNAFKVTDGNRARIKQYLLKAFPSLMMESMVDLAVQTEKASLAIKGDALTDDEALAELALLAAVADKTTPGGSRSGPDNLPEVKTGSLEKKTGLSEGEKIRFKWGDIDTKSMSSLFGVKLTAADAVLVVGGGNGAPASQTTPNAQTPQTETLPVAEATTPVPTTLAPETQALTTAEPATEELTTEEPTTEEPTTEEPTTEEPTTEEPTTEPEEPAVSLTTLRYRDIYIGQRVVYGEFEQDGDTSNGPEPVEWIIYYKGKENVYMVSRYILDSIRFSQSSGSTGFNGSYLDRWLEGDQYAFKNQAFSNIEQSLLAEQELDPPKNEMYPRTKQAGMLYRDVAVFSVNELIDYLPWEFYQASATPYALQKGLREQDGFSPWWTRTLGKTEKYACVVTPEGDFDYEGELITKDDIGVRPVIAISNSLFGK